GSAVAERLARRRFDDLTPARTASDGVRLNNEARADVLEPERPEHDGISFRIHPRPGPRAVVGSLEPFCAVECRAERRLIERLVADARNDHWIAVGVVHGRHDGLEHRAYPRLMEERRHRLVETLEVLACVVSPERRAHLRDLLAHGVVK